MPLKTAINHATKLHQTQRRKTGESFVTHPLRVMCRLQKLGLSEDILMVAVLHDVCEKTIVTEKEITQAYGKEISEMINALTKEKPKNATQNEILTAYAQKIQNIGQKYPGVFLVKMADQIDNVKDTKAVLPHKREEKIQEIIKYFLPIYRKAEKAHTASTPKEIIDAHILLRKKLEKLLKIPAENTQCALEWIKKNPALKSHLTLVKEAKTKKSQKNEIRILEATTYLLCALEKTERTSEITQAYDAVMQRIKKVRNSIEKDRTSSTVVAISK